MRRNYRGNMANEINMLGCVAFAARYVAVVGESVLTFLWMDSRILRTGVLRDRQWEHVCG